MLIGRLPAAAIFAITALSFFIYPGHRYLEQDTQIYVPILEHQWSGALAGDLIVEHPHVSFTLYDELINGLRWLTRIPLEYILEGMQFLFRATGFLGIYFIALSFEIDSSAAILVVALWALGANIQAPAVLTVEYEPTPRSFAVPLLFLGIGFALRHRYQAAGLAAAGAVLLHAPTTWPFLVIAAAFVLHRKRAAPLLLYPLLGLVLLIGIGLLQPTAEHQSLFGRLPPAQEALQRLRASYSYVSTWWMSWAWQYEFFAAIAVGALFRMRAVRDQWIWLGGLVIIGLLSAPISWLLLEQLHLAIVPQIQPARALLFVTAVSVLSAAVAGARANAIRRHTEGAAWFLFCLLVPFHAAFFEWPGWRALLVLTPVAIALAVPAPRWRMAAVLLLAPLMSYAAGAVLPPHLATADLRNLAQWARVKSHGVYLFPEAQHNRAPGWFRAESLQPLYVDWKGGGQVNYLRGFSEQWALRWNQVITRKQPENYSDLSVNYLVYPRAMYTSLPLAFHNSSWWVYRLPAPGSLR